MSELLERMKDAFIQCPDCEDVYGDEQYTCAKCLCEGGQGTLTCREVLDGHVADLRARLAAAEADAERYRWLRDGNDEKGTAAHRIAVRLYGSEWDDSIDKARGAGDE